MSKFDAAIALLQHIEGWPDRNVIAANYIQIIPKVGEGRAEIKAAIRLLEAAGKVDKEASMIALTWIPLDRLPIGLSALISALPGKD